jgi:hypothetical protein
MPRFKSADYGLKFVPVDFSCQVLPGSFEHALKEGRSEEEGVSSLLYSPPCRLGLWFVRCAWSSPGRSTLVRAGLRFRAPALSK